MLRKSFSSFLIVAHLFTITVPAYAVDARTVAEDSEDIISDTSISSMAYGFGNAANNNDLAESAVDHAVGNISDRVAGSVEGWLHQFGTARVNLSLDKHADWGSSSVDWLVPLWETKQNVLFTQLGYRAPDGRRTINSGLGVRTFNDKWMYGANVFLDNDMTGHNRRMGMGVEAWRDYYKFSANTYWGLTDWHQSRDFVDYNERPADGWDIRFQAWLPALPQFGSQFAYEKYRGNSVALSNKDTRYRNPSAFTAGLSYTPVPLVSLAADERMGSGGHNDTQFSLKLRYQPGTPWRRQVSPDEVGALRSLAGSRYELVERNNTIVLDYRHQDVITLLLPKELKGEGGSSLDITAQIASKYAISGLDWNVTPLTRAGGKLTNQETRTIHLTLPEWKMSGSNQYRINAVAMDTKGNRSKTASTLITISEPSALLASGSVSIIKNNASADGMSTNEIQAKVTGSNGQPISGQTVTFNATNGATVKVATVITDTDGIARAALTNSVSGNALVTASLSNGQSANVTVTFVNAARILAGDLKMIKDNALADGISKNFVQARVTNGSGGPLGGQTVSFNATNGTLVTVITGTTGVDGIALATLSSKQSGKSVVTAGLQNGQKTTVTASFASFAQIAAGSLVVLQNNQPADGIAKNSVQATITDAAGKPMPEQKVSFSATNGALVSEATVTTGADGMARTNLTSTRAGNSIVTATLADGNKATVNVVFAPSVQVAAGDLIVTKNNAAANGVSTDTVQARVTNGAGEPLSGEKVSFSATNGAKVTIVTGITGADGIARANLSSSIAGSTVVTATLSNGNSYDVTATFTAVDGVGLRDVTVLRNNALADGSDTDKVLFKVTDGLGIAMSGIPVTFSANNGAIVSVSSASTASDGTLSVTLTNTKKGDVTLTAALEDGTSANVIVKFVASAEIQSGSFVVTANNAVADGAATNAVQLKIVNGNGIAVPGQQVTFSATNGAQVTASTSTTDGDGLATTTLTSTTTGDSTVAATLPDGTRATVAVRFITSAEIQSGSFVVTANNAVADGAATNAVQLKIVNGNGVAVPGQRVSFSATNGAQVTASTATTDGDGLATTTLTSTTAGDSTVTATLPDGTCATVAVTFITSAEIQSGSFVVTANNAVADGAATNAVQLKIVNSNGVAVPGQQVTFSATNGARVTARMATTDGDGLATTTLTSTTTGDSTVTASLSDGTHATVVVTFISPVEIESGSFVVTVNNAAADGAATNAVQLKVVNGNGEGVAGQQVTFSATNGARVIADTATTDANGLATTTLTSITAGESVVKATLISTGENLTVNVSFSTVYGDFAAVVAGGERFSSTDGFPETGFSDAKFTLTLPDGTSADDYIWKTSASWVSASADSGTASGVVKFNGTGTGSTVTVTATPKSGTTMPYRYTIHVKKWFLFGTKEQARSENMTYCTSAGYQTPSYTDMTNAPASRKNGSRAIGPLWSEWGDMTQYNTGIRSNFTYMASENDASVQYSVRLTTGWVYDTAPAVKNTPACMLTF